MENLKVEDSFGDLIEDIEFKSIEEMNNYVLDNYFSKESYYKECEKVIYNKEESYNYQAKNQYWTYVYDLAQEEIEEVICMMNFEEFKLSGKFTKPEVTNLLIIDWSSIEFVN